jgi:tRNA(fMet)-specific endonuclease VapC
MTTRYLLDTDICIYTAKARPPEVAERLGGLAPGSVAMSVVTLGELVFGAERSQARQQAMVNLARLVELIPVLDLPEAAGRHYGRIRAALTAAGTPIGNNDLWIAAHAAADDLILVSNNCREFERVPGLQVENWVRKV